MVKLSYVGLEVDVVSKHDFEKKIARVTNLFGLSLSTLERKGNSIKYECRGASVSWQL